MLFHWRRKEAARYPNGFRKCLPPSNLSDLIDHVLPPVSDSLESLVSIDRMVQLRALLVRELHEAEALPVWILDESDKSVITKRDALIVIGVKAELAVALSDSLYYTSVSVEQDQVTVPLGIIISATDRNLLSVHGHGYGWVSRAQRLKIELNDLPILNQVCLINCIAQSLNSIKRDHFVGFFIGAVPTDRKYRRPLGTSGQVHAGNLEVRHVIHRVLSDWKSLTVGTWVSLFVTASSDEYEAVIQVAQRKPVSLPLKLSNVVQAEFSSLHPVLSA